MNPENIDQLFKDRLADSSPTPPEGLWSRLQERLEELVPQQQAPVKKQGFWWVYSSVAASIVLFIAFGIVLLNVKHNQVPVLQNEVQQQLDELPQPYHKLNAEAAPVPAAPVTVAESSEAESEKILNEQATEPPLMASTGTKARRAAVAEAATTGMKKTPIKATVQKKVSLPQEGLASDRQNISAAASAPVAALEPQPTPTVKESIAAVPVEIIIKRAVEAPKADSPEPSGLEKKTHLAKSIFKQVRNLSNGERVELSELGIQADKIAVETQIGKQKFSKVIHL